MSATNVEKAPETAANDIANTLNNMSINEHAEDKAAANEAASASAAEGRRLYIGNLAYATTEGELKDFFKSYLVESVSIPKNPRTDRPVGYAFVDLSTPTEADNAIAELSGKEILERRVSVQLARKPEAAGEKTDGTNGDGIVPEGSRRRSSARGRGRGRGRGGRGTRGGRAGEFGDDGKDGEVSGIAPTDSEAAPLAAGATNEVHPSKDMTNQSNADGDDKASKTQARPPRERRERGPPADGIPSKTKVMVANLPYDLTEEKLVELFKAYEPSSAKIALRPIPRFMIKKLQARGEARKGRGFGFVTLASEEQQQKAVEEMNGKEIEGREIAVKVAIDSPDKTDEEANAPAGEHGDDGNEASQAVKETATSA
ncbi:RNP domain protein [Drechmeria coniospora]|uniref:RNP domain protein n=1 Tax=Drechmeria coniospora TaxID=98403 RepID=A0A151GR64_DRECN|nr:RNP domain protein [Drechmeria coniospora]KYK59580.1 RNP domain protein [Drechmeria coniospora]